MPIGNIFSEAFDHLGLGIIFGDHRQFPKKQSVSKKKVKKTPQMTVAKKPKHYKKC